MKALLRLEIKLTSMRASTRLILLSSLLIGIIVPLFMGYLYDQIDLAKTDMVRFNLKPVSLPPPTICGFLSCLSISQHTQSQWP